MPPQEQVASSISANESFVRRVESLSADEQDRFSLDLFGIQADLGGLAAMRLGEHALHTWDVAVMADPTAEVPADEVALLVDTVSLTAGRAAAPVDGAGVFAIKTTAPERSFVVDGGAGALLEVAPADATTLTMPAEAFVRLVYGRLDDRHTPDTVAAPDDALDVLRTVFPGF
jgi:hypothetical protein